MSNSKKVLLRCLSIVFGLLVAGLIGELALRMAGYSPTYLNPLHAFHEGHPLLGYRGKPNFTGRFRRAEFNVIVSHDENGFRRQVYQNPKEKSRRKVLVFGDSFTWGWGVAQGKVFTERMSQLMPDYHVMNFGLNASGTVEQYTLFEAYGNELIQPGDTLVLMFFGNDFKNNVEGDFRAEWKDGEVRRVGPTRVLGSTKMIDLPHASYLINFLIFSAEVVKETLEEEHAKKRAPKLLGLGELSPEIVVTRHFLREFQKTLAQKQARFVAVYIPRQGELGETANLSDTRTKQDRGFRRAFFACAESQGILTLDLLPYFLQARQSGEREPFTFPRDTHWTENGHAVAGKAIAEFILAADKYQERMR